MMNLFESTDAMYMGAPLVLVVAVVAWHLVHDVSMSVIMAMVVAAPVLFYFVFSERLDGFWLRREAMRPAQVLIRRRLPLLSYLFSFLLNFLFTSFDDFYVALCSVVPRGHHGYHHCQDQNVLERETGHSAFAEISARGNTENEIRLSRAGEPRPY
jgi:hypothetical protein